MFARRKFSHFRFASRDLLSFQVIKGFKDMFLIKLNESTAAKRRIPFFLVQDSDYITPLTGQSFSGAEIKVYKNGGSEANMGGSATEIGGGQYYYEFSAGEVDTNGQLTVRVNKSGGYAVPSFAQVSDGLDINLSQIVPIENLSAKTTQTTGDCLSAARAEGAGAWDISASTITIKGPDGSTVRVFTTDSPTVPTERV